MTRKNRSSCGQQPVIPIGQADTNTATGRSARGVRDQVTELLWGRDGPRE